MAELTSIIYPECHLDSPIVAGKLVELIMYARLPCNQELNDETLIRNININIQKNKRTPLIIAQEEFGEYLIRSGLNIKRIKHVPYPFANEFLFRLTDNDLTAKLFSLFKLSHSCYSKISQRLVRLKKLVESRLGETKDQGYAAEMEYENERAIVNLHLRFETSAWFKPFLFWFALKTDMRDLIKNNKTNRKRSQQSILHYDLRKYYIQMNRNLVLIYNKQTREAHYLTNEMVLMFSDVVEGRLMIDVAMNTDTRFREFKARGRALWRLIDSLFVDLGNQTYNIVAMIEPLTLGYLQMHDKSPELKGAFLKYALDEIKNELDENGIYHADDQNLIFDAIDEIFNLPDIHMIAEFFSFFRTFGHPILEASEAATKVREHMNKPKILKFNTLMKGHALFCGFIINGYRERHGGSWPPLTLPQHASRPILAAYHNNESLTDELCILEWKSFVGLRFKCFMNLTLDDDLTMFMKDKALAAIKSEWDSVYPKEGMIYNPPSQTTSRRLVERFLEDDKFDPVLLMNYVLNKEYLEDEDFNISYSLKEKEIKKVGRLFAKMTYKMRACQVVAESLIANGIGKYFKENGMAKDEHELLKTLHKLSVSSIPKDNKTSNKSESYQENSNLSNSQNTGKRINWGHYQLQDCHQSSHGTKKSKLQLTSRKIDYAKEEIQYETMSTFLTTDLQKFCLNWRQETSGIFAQRLNEIYGLPNFFNWMHPRLEKSVLYVADPHCPPKYNHHIELNDVENDQIFIKYPMGGIEGYCQKLWTIITIPFLFLSAYEVGTKIAAVVQGDNQAIAITKRVHPNLSYTEKKIKSTQVAQQYFNQLRNNMAAIGHNLKANETIVSSHFFVYSKRIYYDGLVLSQALKPISRVVFWSETLVDETRSACSNISTALAKSIEQGFHRWIAYGINIIKVLQQLIISLKYTINPSMTDDITEPLIKNTNWLICAAIIPSQLGGFNYLNMCRLYVRNIGDPVTASIADIKRLISAKLLDESILQKIMLQDPGESDYLDWASDPYSVNLPNSQSVTVMLKNVTARSILSNSENPMLKGLFHFDFDQEDRDLARFLLDRPIVIPRAAHEIMDNSLTGARQEIAGMLDTTKGLIRNSIRAGGIKPSLVEKLSLYDYNQFRVFNNIMKIKKEDKLINYEACSVHLAITLRKRMWAKLTHGRPIYGLEVPDTIEAIKGFIIKECEDCDFCAAGNNQYGWFFVPSHCELDKVNQESNKIRIPYFGSTTDERSEIKLSHVSSPSRALRAAVRIAMVYTWAFGDDETSWNEAWYLSSFRANLTIDELKAITPISTSNNIAHRLRDRSTQMKYSGSALSRVGRYTVISNDNLNFEVEGVKVDTNLIYQQIMLIGLSSLEDKFRYNQDTGDINTLLHLHINKGCCVIQMSEHPYVSSENVLPQLQQVDCNKLIYDDDPIIDKEQLKIHNQLFRSGTLDFPNWDISELHETLAQSLSMTIIEIITKENRDHMNEFKVLSLEDDINSMITEFLLVNPSQFSIYLGMYIAINWSFDVYYRRPEGKAQMIEFLSTILKTTHKNNLSVLANALSHPVVFTRFWDAGLIEPVYGPNLMTQNYTNIAIDLLIISYSSYIDYWLNGDTLEYLITETEDQIVDQRFEITQARHLCFLASLYLDRSDMPIIRGLTSIEKCTVMTEIIMQQKFTLGYYTSWNTDILPIIIHSASLTYLRRGTIKHLKLRNYISAESFGYDKMISLGQEPRIFDLPMKVLDYQEEFSFHTPAINLMSNQFSEFNFKIDTSSDLNRWESHVHRRIGLNSTSCYKAMEISNFIQDKVDPKSDRCFLGEGSGSMLATYLMTLGEAKTYYNSGVSASDSVGQRVLRVYPSEFSLVVKNNPDNNKLESLLYVLFNGKPESTWIGNMSSFKYIMNTIPHHSLGLLHNDMESSIEKDNYTILLEQVHSLCLAVNLLNDNGVYITKVAPRFEDYTNNLINLMYSMFSEVIVFIPASSNPHSTEIYLILRNKKLKTIIYPSMFMDTIIRGKIWPGVFVSEIILNMKLKNSMAYQENHGYTHDYLKSDLKSLSKTEKYLMSFGFRLNGPKIIKQLSGHDVSSGRENLLSSINLQLNNLLNLFDQKRDSVPFFDPYPILESSQLRELVEVLCKKVACFWILYSEGNELKERARAINNLRKRSLVLDMSNAFLTNIINTYLIKRMEKMNIAKFWCFKIPVVEIKMWWKIVGYSTLIIT
ncbi:polymerase [Hipposideros bat paramyxovirus]|nr:polymerase [Hipposideros bat paramyxovirus]